MKIAILLPLKENFSQVGSGAVTILVNTHLLHSKFKSKTKIYGSNVKTPLNKKHFVSLNSNKHIFSNRSYVNSFIEKIDKNIELIELHNRPKYFLQLKKHFPNTKFSLFFHNNPTQLIGSSSVKERLYIYRNCDKIIFLSYWIKDQFFKGLKITNDNNLKVFYPGVKKILSFPKNKKNIILFVGKLNKSKGYHLFLNFASKFIPKNKTWSALAIGSEARREIERNEYVKEMGDITNDEVLRLLSVSKIAVANSTWEEPLGRLPLEAASRGCFPITSGTGGLLETLTEDFSVLKENTAQELLKKVSFLKKNPKKLLLLQKKVFKNFNYHLRSKTKELDEIRFSLFQSNNISKINKKLKILHIASFNETSDGNLFYATSNKINNGFIKLGHFVHSLDEKDFVRKNIINSVGKLNKKILNIVINLNPNIIIIGHSDRIYSKTFNDIKLINPNVKILRWYIDSISPEFLIKNKKILFDNIDKIDHIFLTSSVDKNKIFKNYKKKFSLIPNPVDSSIEVNKNHLQLKHPYDIFFALSHGQHRGNLKTGKLDERDSLVKYLNDNLPSVKKFFIASDYNNPKWGSEFYHYIKNSRMGLNISRGKSQNLYSSDRIATLVGNGLLTFVDKKTNYGKFFNDKELVFFTNKQDLVKKINYFKNNEPIAKEFAMNAYKKYHKYFSSEKVCSFMLYKAGFGKKQNFFWVL
jgi:glycosyltransferase involved in cell wall biosynthesis